MLKLLAKTAKKNPAFQHLQIVVGNLFKVLGFDLFHTQNGMHCMDVAYYANCPWVRMFPEKPSQNGKVTFATSPGGSPSNQAFALSANQQEELEEHRRQGHMPFHPQCLECARGRSTFQHRRRAGGARQAERFKQTLPSCPKLERFLMLRVREL